MDLINALLAVALPAVASLLFGGVKKLIPVLDGLSALVQQFIAVLFAAGAGWVAAHLGITLPLDVHQWDQATLLAILNGLAAIGFHAVSKTVRSK